MPLSHKVFVSFRRSDPMGASAVESIFLLFIFLSAIFLSYLPPDPRADKRIGTTGKWLTEK